MNTSTSNTEKQFRFYRLREIIGDSRQGIPAIVPVSKSTWYAGVKEGRFPKPVKLTERTRVWLSTDIDALVERIKNNQSQEEA